MLCSVRIEGRNMATDSTLYLMLLALLAASAVQAEPETCNTLDQVQIVVDSPAGSTPFAQTLEIDWTTNLGGLPAEGSLAEDEPRIELFTEGGNFLSVLAAPSSSIVATPDSAEGPHIHEETLSGGGLQVRVIKSLHAEEVQYGAGNGNPVDHFTVKCGSFGEGKDFQLGLRARNVYVGGTPGRFGNVYAVSAGCQDPWNQELPGESKHAIWNFDPHLWYEGDLGNDGIQLNLQVFYHANASVDPVSLGPAADLLHPDIRSRIDCHMETGVCSGTNGFPAEPNHRFDGSQRLSFLDAPDAPNWSYDCSLTSGWYRIDLEITNGSQSEQLEIIAFLAENLGDIDNDRSGYTQASYDIGAFPRATFFTLEGISNFYVETDLCRDDPEKMVPGICGCGTPDTDTNENGIPDCLDENIDLCPQDANKSQPGICGCGESDNDTDGDGVSDCQDYCPENRQYSVPHPCGCATYAEPDWIFESLTWDENSANWTGGSQIAIRIGLGGSVPVLHLRS